MCAHHFCLVHSYFIIIQSLWLILVDYQICRTKSRHALTGQISVLPSQLITGILPPILLPYFNAYTAKPVCWNGWISDSYCSLKPLCSGMGEVVLARTSPTLLPPSPRTVLSLSCFKVSQCINCHDWHCKV